MTRMTLDTLRKKRKDILALAERKTHNAIFRNLEISGQGINLETAVKLVKLPAMPGLLRVWPSPHPLYVSFEGLKEELKRWL